MKIVKLNIFERKTDAPEIIRGYYYQFLKTLEEWLTLYNVSDNFKIHCEVDDDFKTENLKLFSFTQIKCYKSSFSINSVDIKKTLYNFYSIFLECKEDNPNFRFITNSKIKDRDELLKNWCELLIESDINSKLQSKVEEILSEYATNGFNAKIKNCKERIEKIHKQSFTTPKGIKSEQSQKIKELNDEINQYKTGLQKTIDEIKINSSKFIFSVKLDFSDILPEDATLYSEKKCIDLICNINDLKYDANLFYHRLISEVIKRSQNTSEDDRILNKHLLNTILQESENLINEGINSAIIDALNDLNSKLENHEERIMSLENLPVNKQPSLRQTINEIESASHVLLNHINHFGIDNTCHIPRTESTTLYNWVSEKDDKKQRIKVLTGNAGCGKSVIMLDLLTKLKNEKTPVLALKSENQFAKDITSLQQKLNLSQSIENIAKQITTAVGKFVIIVDQLDALSHGLQNSFDYIETYNLLIHILSKIDNVKIIISVRVYDLNYDTTLAEYRNTDKINVNILSTDGVRKVLEHYGLNKTDFPQRFVELLRTPLHLQIFCNLRSQNIDYGNIKNIQDLYSEFWKQKILEGNYNETSNAVQCQNTIYEIAQTIERSGDYSIDISDIKTEFSKELTYLRSNSIIIGNDYKTQFFHQTFFDFVFAKQFVTKNGQLLDYIIKNKQEISIRSKVRMILSFLKSTNELLYIKSLKNILISKKYLFHIKELVIVFLGFESQIINSEKSIAMEIILLKQDYSNIFLESVQTSTWFDIINQKNIYAALLTEKESLIDKILRNFFTKKNKLNKLFLSTFDYTDYNKRKKQNIAICFQLLQKQVALNLNINEVVEVLLNLPEFENKEIIVSRLLIHKNIWKSPNAFKVYDKFNNFINSNRSYINWILQAMGSIDIDAALIRLDRYIEENNLTDDSKKFDYSDIDLIKKLYEINNEKVFNYCCKLLFRQIYNPLIPLVQNRLFNDRVFGFHSFESNGSTHDYNTLSLFIWMLKDSAEKQAIYYKTFLSDNLSTNSKTLICAIIQGLLIRPENQIESIIALLKNFKNLEAFNDSEGKAQYFIKKLLKQTYHLYNDTQKFEINEILLNIKVDWENSIYLDQKDNKRKYYNNFGYTKFTYLNCLPDEGKTHPQIKKTYNELLRKFDKGNQDNTEHGSAVSMGVAAPISVYSCSKMNNSELLQSMLKYSNKERKNYIWPPIGDSEEHAKTFRTIVSENPNRYFKFIKSNIHNHQILTTYITSGLEGLKDGNIDAVKFQIVFTDFIKTLPIEHFELIRIVWLTDYLIKSKLVDKSIFSFLKELVLNHPDPQEDKSDILNGSLNCVRGAALTRILEVQENEYSTEVFDLLDKVIVFDKTETVKAAIIFRMNALIRLDKSKAFLVFCKLNEISSIAINKISITMVRPFCKDHFQDLKKYFHSVFESNDKETVHQLGIVIALCWLWNINGSWKLLMQFAKNSSPFKSGVVEVARVNLSSKRQDLSKKSYKLFKSFFNDYSKEVSDEYEVFRMDFKKMDFEKIYGILNLYSKSKRLLTNSIPFLEALLQNMKNYPLECFLLFENYYKVKKRQVEENDLYNDLTLKTTIAFYNEFRKNRSIYKNEISKCMKLFDDMMKKPYYRQMAKDVLVEIEQ